MDFFRLSPRGVEDPHLIVIIVRQLEFTASYSWRANEAMMRLHNTIRKHQQPST
jgi:hypothetical protein